MRFDVLSAPRSGCQRRIFAAVGANAPPARWSGVGVEGFAARVNDAPTSRRILLRSIAAARRLHPFKTTASIVAAR
jgi:hypothetical protein